MTKSFLSISLQDDVNGYGSQFDGANLVRSIGRGRACAHMHAHAHLSMLAAIGGWSPAPKVFIARNVDTRSDLGVCAPRSLQEGVTFDNAILSSASFAKFEGVWANLKGTKFEGALLSSSDVIRVCEWSSKWGSRDHW